MRESWPSCWWVMQTSSAVQTQLVMVRSCKQNVRYPSLTCEKGMAQSPPAAQRETQVRRTAAGSFARRRGDELPPTTAPMLHLGGQGQRHCTRVRTADRRGRRGRRNASGAVYLYLSHDKLYRIITVIFNFVSLHATLHRP